MSFSTKRRRLKWEPNSNKVNNPSKAVFSLCFVAPQLNASAFAIVASSLEKSLLSDESSPSLELGSEPISCIEQSLNPTMPVIPRGVSRHLGAATCVLLGASPNKFIYF